jgi:hypothetical protein
VLATLISSFQETAAPAPRPWLFRGLGRRRHHDRVLGPLREIGGELVLKSGCQFAHETAARPENAVKLAGG